MSTAYLSIEDRAERERITHALHGRGWSVVTYPTGFHLLSELADVIEGRARELPALIVVDAYARGCAGTTIAAGLHDLGLDIPVEIIPRRARRSEPDRVSSAA